MLAEERRQQILHALSRQGAVTVTILSQTLGYSESTLRRDLQRMARAGLLRRTHGGAVVERTYVEPEPRPQDKAVLHRAEKRAIGHAAARLVAPGDVVALNGGTTTVQVAHAFRGIADLHVVTNSIAVAAELADQAVEVTVTGGTLRRSLELAGPLTEQTVGDLYVRTAFIGVDGLSLQYGLTTYNLIEARTNRAIIERAERVVVVADHTKIGKVTTALIAPCRVVSTLITDAAAPPERLDELRMAGIEVIIAL
jgi:DeoR/GlpR family transcriptional regulator of sugar metabolism